MILLRPRARAVDTSTPLCDPTDLGNTMSLYLNIPCLALVAHVISGNRALDYQTDCTCLLDAAGAQERHCDYDTAVKVARRDGVT